MRGKVFDVDKVLLDSGAWICIFGDNFLQELLAGGALKAKIDLLESLDVYRVSGIHNHAVDTRTYIQGDIFLSHGKCYGFEDKQYGVTVNAIEFYYLPGTKEVIVGRPALQPAELLPEQQLQRMLGKVVTAAVKNAPANKPFEDTPEDDQTDEPELTESQDDLVDTDGVFPFFTFS